MKNAPWYEKLAFWCCLQGRVRVIEDHLVPGVAYLIRFYVLMKERPWWFPFNLFLHQILRSDGGGLHDHPWWYVTIVLAGGYWETTTTGRRWIKPGSILVRRSTSLHRLEIAPHKPCWTLFLCGRRKREWGFVNSRGQWEHSDSYISTNKVTNVHSA